MAVGLTCFLEPLDQPLTKLAQRKPDDQIQAYAAAIINSLREERDFERRDHEQYRKQAESHILDLEARLARRDVELEAWLVYGKTPPKSSSPVLSEEPTPAKLNVPRLTAEDALQVMQATSARNKELEQEVRALSEMVRPMFSP